MELFYSLSHNNLGDSGALHVATCLGYCIELIHLRYIHVYGNVHHMYCNGVTTALYLSLEKDELTDDGLIAVMEGLKSHTSLRELKLVTMHPLN